MYSRQEPDHSILSVKIGFFSFLVQIVENIASHAQKGPSQVSRACIHRRPFNIQSFNFISQDSPLLTAQCKPDTVHSQNPKRSLHRIAVTEMISLFAIELMWFLSILKMITSLFFFFFFFCPTVRDTKTPATVKTKSGRRKETSLFYKTRNEILRYHVLEEKKNKIKKCFLSIVGKKKLNIIYCIGYYYSNNVPCDPILVFCTELRIQ